MMKLKNRLLASAALAASVGVPSVVLLTTLQTASAQTTAQPSQLGYVATSGCTPSTLTACFMQYGVNSGGLPVSIVGGNLSVGNLTIGNVSLGPGNSTIGTVLLGNGTSTNILGTVFLGNGTVTLSGNLAGITSPISLIGNQSFALDQIDGIAANTAASGTLLVGLADGNGTKIYSTSNALNIDCVSGCAGNVTVGNISLAAGNATIGALLGNQSVNEQQIAGTTVSVNNGTTDAGTERVTLSSDSTGQVKLTTSTAQIGNITNVGNLTSIVNALPAGTNTLGNITNLVTLGNITGTPMVTLGNGSLSSNLGVVVISGATTLGTTPYHLANGTTAGNNSTNVKNAAGTLYGVSTISTSGNLTYLRMYNTSSAPNCASGTGVVLSWPIPSQTTGAGAVLPMPPMGVAFGTGISFCITGATGDSDNTNSSTGTFVNLYYE